MVLWALPVSAMGTFISASTMLHHRVAKGQVAATHFLDSIFGNTNSDLGACSALYHRRCLHPLTSSTNQEETHTHTCMHAHTNTHTHISTYKHTHTHTLSHTHTNTHAHTHTRTHTHTKGVGGGWGWGAKEITDKEILIFLSILIWHPPAVRYYYFSFSPGD